MWPFVYLQITEIEISDKFMSSMNFEWDESTKHCLLNINFDMTQRQNYTQASIDLQKRF